MRFVRRWLQIAAAVALAGSFAVTNDARAEETPAEVKARGVKEAQADPLLRAMVEELRREQALLVLPGMQRPYFMEYRLDDFATWEAVATYGALTREDANHQRVVRVTVRVGAYTSDSSSARGDGAVELAPRDNDPEALRYALWLATDEAYKAALKAYSTKQAALKRFEKPPTEPDFAAAVPMASVEPVVPLELDRAEWKRRIVDASGVVFTESALKAEAQAVEYSTASVRGVAVNRYLVNTEGTVVRHGYGSYGASYSVGGQAEDGMRLGRDNGTTGTRGAELESAEAFHQRALDDVKSYLALRRAPVVDAEDYHGPVLLDGDAASDMLNRLFVPNLLAGRPDMGTTARTVGAYQASLHARVLPELLTVVDDPRMATWKGRGLLGAYTVDDEGVEAERVQVVTKGKLEGFLTARTPIRDFPKSNGHGRAAPGQPASAQPGVLVVTAAAPVTHEELRAKLLAMAKEQQRDVYEAETLGGELAPRVLYRVHPDGTRQLVRGATFDELDLRSLRSEVVAAGDDAYVQQLLGPIPQTTIAPSLLFGDIGVKRASEQQQKLPYYAPPAVPGTAPAGP